MCFGRAKGAGSPTWRSGMTLLMANGICRGKTRLYVLGRGSAPRHPLVPGAHDPVIAGLAGHRDLDRHGIEEPEAFGVQRVCPEQVPPGQELEGREPDGEAEPVRLDADGGEAEVVRVQPADPR